MSRVLADHQDRAISADYLALLAHRLDGSSNLHCSGSRIEYRIPACPMSRTAGTTGPMGRPGKIAGAGTQRFPPGPRDSVLPHQRDQEAVVALDADRLDRR